MPNIIRQSSSNFDHLAAAARSWSFELSKLDRAEFWGDILQWIQDDFVFCRGVLRGRLKQGGHPPLGMRTVAVPAVRDMAMLWRGHQVDGAQFCVFPLGGELDAVSDSRFDMFTISFREDALLDRAEKMGVRGVADRLRSTEVFDAEPARMEHLRQVLVRADSAVRTGNPCSGALGGQFLDHLIGLIDGPDFINHRSRRPDRRLQAVRSSNFYLAERIHEPISVKDLSRAAGVSVRTLQYAFREYMGVSPKAYIQSMRLNAVRKVLRSSRPGTNCVADVANQLGFWHMGQFAADYRRLFGENPSETLDRVI